MKKLLAALVLCAGTAFAAEDTQVKDTPQANQAKTQEGRRISTGIDATEVGPGIANTAKDAVNTAKDAVGAGKDAVGLQTKEDGTFKTAQSFNLKGNIKNLAGGGVTIVRPGLPDADLDVRKETLVMLDGKKVELRAIPEGAPVSAKFQLEGEEVVAVELRAKSTGIKKDMKKDVKQEMKKDDATGGAGFREDVKEGAHDVKQDVKQGAQEVEQDVKD
jgi:acylphosphatase